MRLEQVEAAPRLDVRRQNRGIGRAQVDPQKGQAQRDQKREQRHEHQHWPSHHAVGEPRPEAAALPGPSGRSRQRSDGDGVDPRSKDAQQGGQEGQRAHDAQRDDQRARQAHRPQRGDVEREQREQADDDRRAREQHGPARGRHGPGDGALDRFATRQLLAEPRDQEQRVVDAEAQAEHGRQIERED